MNDAEFKAQKKRLQALRNRWHNCLGLRWWTVTHNYERDTLVVNGEMSATTAASCTADWRYLQATVSWNLALVADQTDAGLERIFVHEMMHILLDEMRHFHEEGGMNHEERVATTLAQAFLWTRETGAKDK